MICVVTSHFHIQVIHDCPHLMAWCCLQLGVQLVVKCILALFLAVFGWCISPFIGWW